MAVTDRDRSTQLSSGLDALELPVAPRARPRAYASGTRRGRSCSRSRSFFGVWEILVLVGLEAGVQRSPTPAAVFESLFDNWSIIWEGDRSPRSAAPRRATRSRW